VTCPTLVYLPLRLALNRNQERDQGLLALLHPLHIPDRPRTMRGPAFFRVNLMDNMVHFLLVMPPQSTDQIKILCICSKMEMVSFEFKGYPARLRSTALHAHAFLYIHVLPVPQSWTGTVWNACFVTRWLHLARAPVTTRYCFLSTRWRHRRSESAWRSCCSKALIAPRHT